MIGKLNGVIDTIYEDCVILDVSGVGYQVFCTTILLNQLCVGDKYSLNIYTDVKEDSIILYGFDNANEKDAFVLLRSVSGVGCKVAMAILSSINLESIQSALFSEDVSVFKSVSGVGPKLAARILLELKNKSFIDDIAIEATAANIDNNLVSDAVSALVNLGIMKTDGEKIVRKIAAENPDISLSDLIRLSLKNRSNV